MLVSVVVYRTTPPGVVVLVSGVEAMVSSDTVTVLAQPGRCSPSRSCCLQTAR